MDIELFKDRVVELAEKKGWSDDEVWLERSLYVEVGELIKAIEEKQNPMFIADEFADVMHFLLQIMKNNTPNVNLDNALMRKIMANYHNQKKTYFSDKGFVRL